MASRHSLTEVSGLTCSPERSTEGPLQLSRSQGHHKSRSELGHAAFLTQAVQFVLGGAMLRKFGQEGRRKPRATFMRCLVPALEGPKALYWHNASGRRWSGGTRRGSGRAMSGGSTAGAAAAAQWARGGAVRT